MSDPMLDGQTAAAAAYEALHVPALFRPWADPVLDAARVAGGDRVLDVACGTGVLARAAAARVGEGAVTGVDLDAGMLAVAAREAPEIAFRQANAAALPFPAGTFDAACCQFGLMFFPDRPAAVSEMRRVLHRGGQVF